jgi:hypothetical protein
MSLDRHVRAAVLSGVCAAASVGAALLFPGSLLVVIASVAAVLVSAVVLS